LVNTTPAIAFSGSVPRLVVHDEDGEWEFLEDDMTGDLTLVHFAHVVAHHPDLSAVADLPPGWAARRGGAGTWQRLLWDDD
jgi:hypothetical protein